MLILIPDRYCTELKYFLSHGLTVFKSRPVQSEDSQLIVSRFFEALAYLKENKKIRGKQTFTRAYGINRWNLNSLQKNPKSDSFQVAWLSYLVRDYGISATWLLTGRGEMVSPMRKGGK